MKRRVVLLGPPASGKGTQAEMIRARYQIPVTSPGAMLRQEKAAGTELGIQADELTRRGALVPDETVCALVRHWLELNDGAFVFDGFPRTAGQARLLDEMLAGRDTPLDAVLFLEVAVDKIRERVSRRMVCKECGQVVTVGSHVASADAPCPRCGGRFERRSDDTAEALGQRMIEYQTKTAPLVPLYEKRGLLARVDGGLTPGQVFAEVSRILEER